MTVDKCQYCGKIAHLNFLGICPSCYNLEFKDEGEDIDALDREVQSRIAREIENNSRQI